MQQMLRIICPNSTWGQRFVNLLVEDFPELPEGSASLEDMGLRPGWNEWGLWRRK